MPTRSEVRALPSAADLLQHLERVWVEFDAAKALLADDDLPWMGMDPVQRQNMIQIIDWALEGRNHRPPLGSGPLAPDAAP